jgi:hypothetical protein
VSDETELRRRTSEAQNPYAPPAADSTPSPSAQTEDLDVARLIKFLPSRRRAFAAVLSIGGGLHAICGAAALATGIKEEAAITSPSVGMAVAALGLGFPLALVGISLALRVRLVQFIAFPLTCVCGGIGGVGLAIAIERASVAWTGVDPPPSALGLLAPSFAFLMGAMATGYLFHSTVMALAQAGIRVDGTASIGP